MDTYSYVDNILKAVGSFSILLGVTVAGFRMIIHHNNPEKRTTSMRSLLYIAIGSIIIGSALVITGYLIQTQNNLMVDMGQGNVTDPGDIINTITDGTGNFISRGFVAVLEGIITAVQNLEGLVGFQPIDKLIFNKGVPGFGTSAITAVTNNIETAPFTADEWQRLNYIYYLISGMTGILLFIMIGKTGISYIRNANNPSKLSMLSEQMGRWLFSVIFIVIAPMALKALFTITNGLTEQLYDKIQNTLPDLSLSGANGIIQKIQTGDILTTATIKALFVYIELKVNIIFIARKIVLIAMFAFTPIAAALWGINDRIHAAMIWCGEVLTNAVMQFFYGFVFFTMIVMLGKGGFQQWFYTLMWMFALTSIAEMLRNSLQGLFTRLSGVNESAMGGQALNAVGKVFGVSGMVNGARAAWNATGVGTEKFVYGGRFKPYTTKQNVDVNPMQNANAGQGGTSGGIGYNANIATNAPSIANGANGKDSGFEFGGNQYTAGESGILLPKSMVNSEKQTSSQAEPELADSRYSDKDIEEFKDADRYNAALMGNLTKETLKYNIGGTVGGIADFIIGHDPQGAAFASAIGNSAGKFHRKVNAWTAINDTITQLSADDGIDRKVATEKLFHSNSKLQQAFRQVKLVNAYANGDSQKAEKLLASWHPYTTANGFTWKA